MLSKNALVKVRKAIELGYTHSCTITINEEYEKPNHSTGFREKDILENEPCRISFSSVSDTEESSSAAKVVQTVKLFIAPETDIPPGSRLTVIHDGITSSFSKSGKPATYPTHQEIALDLWEGWA